MGFARAVARISLPVALLLGLVLATAAPVAASEPKSEYDRVVEVAMSKIGAPWVHYAKGPDKFDCVGFVWYAFHENGLQDRIGGRRGVRAYYNWFKERGLASRSDPQPGDLVIWGDFQHIGIYLGNDMAISALINPYGVKVHPVSRWIPARVKAYLHTMLTV